MVRHKTDPAAGYAHTEDHCDLCAAQVAWACREVEKLRDEMGDLRRTVNELTRKRRDSEVRKRERVKRAAFYRRLFYAMAGGGVAPWVYQLGQWVFKKLGG